MARYYFNENPHVGMWKDKYSDVVADYNSLVDKYNEAVDKFNAISKENYELKQEITEMEEDMKDFNSLPWYERIFYKFCV